MNPILLKQRVSKWIDACQYLKSAEIKEQLSAQEWTAVEELSNLWNKNFTANGVKDDALAHIDTLKQCEDMHPNNLKIKEQSKALTGVAREMLTKDEATYNEFKEALKKEIKQNRPSSPVNPPRVEQKPPRVEQKPPRIEQKPPRIEQKPPRVEQKQIITARDISISSVEFRNTDDNERIINDYGKTLFVGSKYIGARVKITTKYSGPLKLIIRIYDSTGKHRGDSDVDVQLKGTGNYELIGYGNDTGTFYNRAGNWRFSFCVGNEEVYSAQVNLVVSQHAKDPVYIDSATFANVTYDGTIIVDYGGTLYNDTQYLKPKLKIRTTRVGITKFNISFKSPSGSVSTIDDEVMLSEDLREVTLVGYGNKQGSFFTPGRWTVSFSVDGTLVKSFNVNIASKNGSYVPPRDTYNDRSSNDGGGGGGTGGSGIGAKILRWLLIAAVVLGGLYAVSNTNCSGDSDLVAEYAVAEGVKMYSKPALNSVVKMRLASGAKLYLLEREGDTGWIHVKTEDDTKGYIHESYVVNEVMHGRIEQIFTNSGEEIVKKLNKMKYQVMKRQALVNLLSGIGADISLTAKIIDADVASASPYEAVAFLIEDGTDCVAASYKFSDSGEPILLHYAKGTDWVSISRFTTSTMKVKTGAGKTTTIDKAN